MRIVINTEEGEWVPHSTAKGVLVKPLITKKEFGEDSPSILLVKIPKGAVVPEHTHEESEDILYILSGHAKMFVEEIGEFEIKKEMLIRVPRRTKHSIYDVTEDLLVYDVFSPGTI